MQPDSMKGAPTMIKRNQEMEQIMTERFGKDTILVL